MIFKQNSIMNSLFVLLIFGTLFFSEQCSAMNEKHETPPNLKRQQSGANDEDIFEFQSEENDSQNDRQFNIKKSFSTQFHEPPFTAEVDEKIITFGNRLILNEQEQVANTKTELEKKKEAKAAKIAKLQKKQKKVRGPKHVVSSYVHANQIIKEEEKEKEKKKAEEEKKKAEEEKKKAEKLAKYNIEQEKYREHMEYFKKTSQKERKQNEDEKKTKEELKEFSKEYTGARVQLTKPMKGLRLAKKNCNHNEIISFASLHDSPKVTIKKGEFLNITKIEGDKVYATLYRGSEEIELLLIDETQ